MSERQWNAELDHVDTLHVDELPATAALQLRVLVGGLRAALLRYCLAALVSQRLSRFALLAGE